MKKNFYLCTLALLLLILGSETSIAQSKKQKTNPKQLYENGVYNPYEVLDTRVDNMRYWRKAAELGLTPVEPERKIPLGIFKSSKIEAKSVVRDDSPDVPVTEVNSTQSENSVFVNPTNPDHVLQSNNSTQNPVGALYGANYFYSFDFGDSWGGSISGAGGSNYGDPSTAINLSGRQYVGYISSSGGMGVSYSNNGTSWTARTASSAGSLDKNHLTVDNSPTSPYEGNVYNSWVAFAGSNNTEIEFVRSTNDGVSYSPAINISSAVNAGSHNQGVNLQTGPNGEVYAVWAIYDSWPSDETAIGYAKSSDGGVTFALASRIISNIRGIRSSETSKNQRVNSFPVMAVDISGGSYDGNIYVVWANIGVPGTNTGNDIDIYMIRSTNQGSTWSSPIRVNQDASGLGHEHYFPWITCDPETGTLSVIFYDDRNVGGAKCEVFCANSFDGGDTWEDFRVSDVDFTPAPIAGLAGGYMGDYLGISARAGKVYPVWTDNRSGSVMTYTSPYETNNLTRPTNLQGALSFVSGQVDLSWEFENTPGFLYYLIYRDNVEIGTTVKKYFTDMLPDYGEYRYQVTAMHDGGESAGAITNLKWGDAHILVNPGELTENLLPGATSTKQITITNNGQLDLEFTASSSSEPIRSRAYCTASTNIEDEWIAKVEIGDINNASSWQSGVADYTHISTQINVGESESITVTNGKAWNADIVYVWVDWNDDQIFEQDGEEEFQLTNVGGAGASFTGTITVPQGTPSGEHRMRVRMTYSSAPQPCGSASWGEVEDYTISVSGWLMMENLTATLSPGQSQIIDVNFEATDLSTGTYLGNIRIESNDPDAAIVDVPVTLNVATTIPLSVEVTATPQSIIQGESSQLNATVTGGTETYTYSWTSFPPGFSSSISNPVVTPDETTSYFVEVSDGVNTVSGSVNVEVESATATQNIALIEGWNLFSSRVTPENPDMLSVVQPLIDDEILYKVIDQDGGTVFHLPFPLPNGTWNNSIGDISASEGYYLKALQSTTLPITGQQTELPLQISLRTGWNMISYPSDEPQNALEIIQPLIDTEVLYKVIDESGGVVFHLPFPPPNGQWSNSIGNFEPGKGYYVKVTADATLTINNPADGYQALASQIQKPDPLYFTTCFQNNPYQPMAIIVEAAGWMESGDEIAVFDGNICVGVGVYKGIQDGFITVPVGMDDPTTEFVDGATAGNGYTIRLWNRNGQTLYDNIPFGYLQGNISFEALETSIIRLNPALTQLTELDKPISISLHPNPMNSTANLEFSLPVQAWASIIILDGMGMSKTVWLKDVLISKSETLILNKADLQLKPGIYTLQILLSEKQGTNPIMKVKKFVVY